MLRIPPTRHSRVVLGWLLLWHVPQWASAQGAAAEPVPVPVPVREQLQTAPAEETAPPTYGARAQVVPPEPTARRLTLSTMREVPGTVGDPFRVLDTLPGVIPIFSGVPYVYVRGAPPAGSIYVYDDILGPHSFTWPWARRWCTRPWSATSTSTRRSPPRATGVTRGGVRGSQPQRQTRSAPR